MKCPKCGYLGFEQLDRCRNCGYDFSLTEAPLPDLTLRQDEKPAPTSAPSNELALTGDAPLGRTQEAPPSRAAEDVTLARPEPPRAPLPELRRENLTRGGGATPELPLFTRGTQPVSDEPLISKPSAPRQPLAVRRATPDVPRLRGELRPSGAAVLEPSVPDTTMTPPVRTGRHVHVSSDEADDENVLEDGEPASLTNRLLAAFLDVIVLAATDFVVVYLTMQICGLQLAELHLLPKRPLLMYLIIQNGGYLAGFTATGQTLGKVAAGIRVVSTEDGRSPRIGQALVRTLLWVVLTVPAGLGLLSILFSPTRRGLHDRAAGTLVVHANL